MKRKILLPALCLLAAFCLLATAAAAEDLKVTATLDRTATEVNQPVTLTILVTGGSADIPQPTWPQFPAGFEIFAGGRAQNVSIVGGKVTSSVSFRYTLIPRTAGNLTVPPAAITHGGKTYRTAPLSVTVSKAAAPAGDGGGAAAAPQAPQLFITGEVDRKRAFVGQQITYTFRMFRRVRLLSRPQFSPPDFSGFVARDLQPKEFQMPHNGVGYQVSELKYALFPLAPGEYTLSPAALQVSVADVANPDPFSAFFQTGRSQTVRTGEIRIDVLPLPEKGRPEVFTGAVGSYRISAGLDRKSVEAGRPVTLTVEVSGKGLVESLPEPEWPKMPSMRRYETISSLNVSNQGSSISGSKTFKVVLIPQSSGKTSVPAIDYPVFDPVRGAYAPLATKPLTITVKPGDAGTASGAAGEKGIRTLHRDIRFIRTEYDGGSPSRGSLPAVYWGVNSVPVAFFLAAAAVAWRRRRILADPLGRRARLALRDAETRCRRAERHARDGTALDCHVALQEAIANYLADKWGVSAAGLTLVEIERRLEAEGLPAEIVRRLRTLWEEADLIRYAPAGSTATDPKQCLIEARSLLRELEGRL